MQWGNVEHNVRMERWWMWRQREGVWGMMCVVSVCGWSGCVSVWDTCDATAEALIYTMLEMPYAHPTRRNTQDTDQHDAQQDNHSNTSHATHTHTATPHTHTATTHHTHTPHAATTASHHPHHHARGTTHPTACQARATATAKPGCSYVCSPH